MFVKLYFFLNLNIWEKMLTLTIEYVMYIRFFTTVCQCPTRVQTSSSICSLFIWGASKRIICTYTLTPKGPRPFFYKKTLKISISIAKNKEIWIFFFSSNHRILYQTSIKMYGKNFKIMTAQIVRYLPQDLPLK